MKRSSTTLGLILAVISAASFGASGAFVKPLLEAGWSPAAAVTFRALIGGIVLLPFAVVSLRGRWSALWRARRRVLLMGLIGVAATQLVYFAAVQRLPIGTAILIEYMGPLLLVAVAWVRRRKVPKVVVLVGSVVSLIGLVLVVAPDGTKPLDPIGLLFAGGATVGCAVYYVIAAQSSDDLSPVALASSGLVIGGIALAIVGSIGILPFTVHFTNVTLLGTVTPWWVPILVIGVVACGIAYATSVTASEILGSRLSSFMGLLEVIFAALYAWILLGEKLTIPQLLGGVAILVGIAFVRSEKTDVPLEPASEPRAPASAARP